MGHDEGKRNGVGKLKESILAHGAFGQPPENHVMVIGLQGQTSVFSLKNYRSLILYTHVTSSLEHLSRQADSIYTWLLLFLRRVSVSVLPLPRKHRRSKMLVLYRMTWEAFEYNLWTKRQVDLQKHRCQYPWLMLLSKI